MELRDYLTLVRKHVLLIVVCTLLAVGAAVGATQLAERQYEATSQLFVSTSSNGSADNPTGLNQGGQFAQERVKSYADLVDSPVVLRQVAEELELEQTVAELAEHVSAEAPLDTVLINVTVTYPDPEVARLLANRVAQRLTLLVDEIEAPQDGGPSPVRLSVVRPADLPLAPSSPRPLLNYALGLLVGLAVGVTAAVLREVLDTSVKSAEQVQAELGLATLGAVGYDAEASKRPLVTVTEPHAPRAEAYRQLRTNLQYVDVDQPPRSIVVTSSVPEEGKSSTACNLALAMTQAGTRVVLVDADLRRPRTAEYMGIEGAVGLSDVLAGRVDVDDVLQPWGAEGSLRVLPAGAIPPNPSELLASRQMRALLEALKGHCDVVVLDAPPLLPVTDAAVLAAAADGAIVVLRAGKTTRDQAAQAVENLRQVGAHVLGVVLNMVPAKGPGAYAHGYGYGYAPRASTPGAGRHAVDGTTAREQEPVTSP